MDLGKNPQGASFCSDVHPADLLSSLKTISTMVVLHSPAIAPIPNGRTS